MDYLEYICSSKGDTYAIILRKEYEQEGINFFTDDSFSQQLGYMKREKGYTIQPHVHKKAPRQIEFTKECLFIKSGKVRLDFYEEDKTYVRSYILVTGDVVLLAFGGHGITMLEESEIIEVKQGPYAEAGDKERFDPISADQVIW